MYVSLRALTCVRGRRAGIPLFMIMMGLSAWIKFEAFKAAALAMMGVLGAGLLYYVLTHAQWVSHVTGNTLKTRKHKARTPGLAARLAGHAWQPWPHVWRALEVPERQPHVPLAARTSRQTRTLLRSCKPRSSMAACYLWSSSAGQPRLLLLSKTPCEAQLP